MKPEPAVTSVSQGSLGAWSMEPDPPPLAISTRYPSWESASESASRLARTLLRDAARTALAARFMAPWKGDASCKTASWAS